MRRAVVSSAAAAVARTCLAALYVPAAPRVPCVVHACVELTSLCVVLASPAIATCPLFAAANAAAAAVLAALAGARKRKHRSPKKTSTPTSPDGNLRATSRATSNNVSAKQLALQRHRKNVKRRVDQLSKDPDVRKRQRAMAAENSAADAMEATTAASKKRKALKRTVKAAAKLAVSGIDPASRPTFEELLMAEQDPEAALRLFHYNSNQLGYATSDHAEEAALGRAENFTAESVPVALKMVWEKVKGAIVSQATKDECVRRYTGLMSHAKPLHACGACGVRALTWRAEDVYRLVTLAELGLLAMSDEQQLAYRTVEDKYRVCLSAYTAKSGSVYHLHQELLEGVEEGEEAVRICSKCDFHIGHGKIPPLSLANGLDAGVASRLGLLDLSLAERMVIGMKILFGVVVKLRPGAGAGSQKGLLGNVIAFDSTGVESACEEFPRLHRLDDSIRVHFVGKKNQLALHKAAALACVDLQVRPQVVYDYLEVLKALHPAYKNIRIVRSEANTLAMQQAAENMLKNVVLVDTDLGMAIDHMSDSRLHGADAEGVGHGEPGTGTAGAPLGDPSPALEYVHVTNMTPSSGTVAQAAADNLASLTMLYDGFASPAVPASDNSAGEVAPDGSLPQPELPSALSSPPPSRHVTITTSSTPTNEFSDNHDLLYSVFSYNFLTGRGLGKGTGGLSEGLRQHLVQQFTCVFAHDQRFLFTLLNQLQRHTVSQVLAARVKNNPVAFAGFSELVADPVFKAKVAEAKQDPTSKVAAEVMRVLMKYVVVAGQTVPFGTVERMRVATKMHALVHRFGLPSIFLTISTDDIHSALNLRMSYPSQDNLHFPATTTTFNPDESDFLQFLQGGQQQLGSVKMNKNNFGQLLASNPAAAASMFQRTMEAVHVALLGLSAEHTTKTTIPFDADPLPAKPGNAKSFTPSPGGVFGKVAAAFSVVEAQGRGR